MFGKFSGWFKALSMAAKVGVVAAGATGLIAVTNVAANPPLIETRIETATVSMPFGTKYQDDDSMLVSETKVLSPGVNGSKLVTYSVTYSNNKETDRKVTKEVVKLAAIDQTSAKGTKVVSTEVVAETIPFDSTTVSSSTMAKGTSQVTTSGSNGTKNITYEVTKVRGIETERSVVKEEVAVAPVTQVTTIGTKVTSNCDPNYSGACVPIAYDVDCAGGSGNGPAYVGGPVYVIGVDIYGLDRDGNGVGCE